MRHRNKKADATDLKNRILAELDGTSPQDLTPADAELLEMARELGYAKLSKALEQHRLTNLRIIIKEAAEEYLEYGRLERSWEGPTLRDATNRLKHFCARFGETYLDELTSDDFRNWRNSYVLADDAGPEQVRSSKRNANNYHSAIHTFLRWSVDNYSTWAHKEDIPTARIPRFPKTSNPIRILSLSEISFLIPRALDSLPQHHRNYFYMALFLPIRPGDLIGGAEPLTWAAVDFDHSELILTNEQASKSRGRQITIPQNLMEYLVSVREPDHHPICRKKSNAMASSWARGKAPHRYDFTQLEYPPGHQPPKWQPDILRHTCISMLMAQTEGNADFVARQAGNSSREIRQSYELVRPKREADIYFAQDLVGAGPGNVIKMA